MTVPHSTCDCLSHVWPRLTWSRQKKKVGVFLEALRRRPVWINISSHVTFISGHTFLQWCSVNQSVQGRKSQHWMLDWELRQSYFATCDLVKFDIWLPCPLLVLLVKVPRRVWLCVCMYVSGVFPLGLIWPLENVFLNNTIIFSRTFIELGPHSFEETGWPGSHYNWLLSAFPAPGLWICMAAPSSLVFIFNCGSELRSSNVYKDVTYWAISPSSHTDYFEICKLRKKEYKFFFS